MKTIEHLQIFDIVLTVRGPLHIGDGKFCDKKEYLYNPRNRMVSFLDENRFFLFLAERGLTDAYESFMLAGTGNLYSFLRNECGLRSNEIQALTRSTLSAADALDENHSLKRIHTFMRSTCGQAYVPGSSLKGALRTAWLLGPILQDTRPHVLPQPRPPFFEVPFPEEAYANLLSFKQASERDRKNAVNSIFRGVSIADSSPIADKNMILCSKSDVFTNGTVNLINTVCRECVCPGTQIRFRVTLDQSILQNRITRESLQKAVLQFDQYYQETYLSHFAAPKRAQALPSKPWLLLGGGAGYFSKTLSYPYLGPEKALPWVADQLARKASHHKHEKDVQRGISPHTVKYGQYHGQLYPFGACEVSFQ